MSAAGAFPRGISPQGPPTRRQPDFVAGPGGEGLFLPRGGAPTLLATQLLLRVTQCHVFTREWWTPGGPCSPGEGRDSGEAVLSQGQEWTDRWGGERPLVQSPLNGRRCGLPDAEKGDQGN